MSVRRVPYHTGTGQSVPERTSWAKYLRCTFLTGRSQRMRRDSLDATSLSRDDERRPMGRAWGLRLALRRPAGRAHPESFSRCLRLPIPVPSPPVPDDDSRLITLTTQTVPTKVGPHLTPAVCMAQKRGSAESPAVERGLFHNPSLGYRGRNRPVMSPIRTSQSATMKPS